MSNKYDSLPLVDDLYHSSHLSPFTVSKDLEGKEMPVFQFYFTPSSGDINIKEDEKFDEYVHMIKNFDILYQGKATRSKTEYTFCMF